MSSIACAQPTHIYPPKIRIQSASPVPFDESTPRFCPRISEAIVLAATQLSKPSPAKSTDTQTSSSRKRTAAIASFEEPTSEESSGNMAPRSSRSDSECPSPKRHSASPPAKRAKPSLKDVDWSDITDPEERRRIQNRIAQRKFREKAREQKEKAERELRNQEHAGNCYRIPLASDVGGETELSGLPWGCLSLTHVLMRGHEAESRRSSGRETFIGDDVLESSRFSISYGRGIPQTISYGSSVAEDAFFDDTSYVYDTSMAPQPYPPLP